MIQTKNYGLVEILGEGVKYNYLRVKFLNTGNIDEFRKDAVFNGEIRDCYAKTVSGVGYTGKIKTRGKYKKAYLVWKNMISRCYDGKNKAYFGKVTVHEHWHCFENFYMDMKCIHGWNKELFESGKLELDKDGKQFMKKEKIYSRQTCMWISKEINNTLQDSQQRCFKAISPSGETYIDYNISKFAKNHGLERRQISNTLHGRFKSTLGWKFKFIDKEIV